MPTILTSQCDFCSVRGLSLGSRVSSNGNLDLRDHLPQSIEFVVGVDRKGFGTAVPGNLLYVPRINASLLEECCGGVPQAVKRQTVNSAAVPTPFADNAAMDPGPLHQLLELSRWTVAATSAGGEGGELWENGGLANSAVLS